MDRGDAVVGTGYILGPLHAVVAGALHLSEHTVARHMQNVFAKLGVSSRAPATSSALQQGLL